MKITLSRESLLGTLQSVIGVVERRQALPILSNALFLVKDGRLDVHATDLEVELSSSVDVEGGGDGETTVPARKLLDIVRALPEGAGLELESLEGAVQVRCGRSRYRLATLPVGDFPSSEVVGEKREVGVECNDLKRLIEKTEFAMAQQDVRYYLNGLLLETQGSRVRTVATDGHRLAVADTRLGDDVDLGERRQVIIPRKGVVELARLVGQGLVVEQGLVVLEISSQAMQVAVGRNRFFSKLVDGKYPEYEGVIPDLEGCGNRAVLDKRELQDSLKRASILSNDKYRAVRLAFKGDGVLEITAHNAEQEEAKEELGIDYEGEELEIGFNVGYLAEAVEAVEGERVLLALTGSSSSVLVKGVGSDTERFVVMPMRL